MGFKFRFDFGVFFIRTSFVFFRKENGGLERFRDLKLYSKRGLARIFVGEVVLFMVENRFYVLGVCYFGVG